jgi:Fe-S-cluster-containing dehydrogenase component/DMSO reductase anchor subunit
MQVVTTAPVVRLPLLDRYLDEQKKMTAVERFSHLHETRGLAEGERVYRDLVPLDRPKPGQQYAFQVDLDACTGCKACVTACHSMNGLDQAEAETWRSVGLLQGGSPGAAVQQTITTACHHCIDPACMHGCPVNAYEKDPITGIVRHLDDQCIGCQYCTLTCPYEVPQFNRRLGIVRKCDMCSGRLEAGEAPACVQACPNEAISIRIVETAAVLEEAQADDFLPGAPSPGITAPTTSYVSKRALPRNMLPADFYQVRPGSEHTPLVFMLVLTQWSVGAFAVEFALRRMPGLAFPSQSRPLHAIMAVVVGLLALSASTVHLGRPLYAMRALIGLRTSWLSREILLFGLFAGLAVTYAGLTWWLAWPARGSTAPAAILPWLAACVSATGLLGVLCSVMLYHATKKELWSVSRTGFRFFATTAVLGMASAILAAATARDLGALAPGARSMALVLAAVGACKLLWEFGMVAHLRDKQLTELKRTAVLLTGELKPLFASRVFLGIAFGVLCPLLTAHAWGAPAVHRASVIVGGVLSVAGIAVAEILERMLFFRAVCVPRMPGQWGR